MIICQLWYDVVENSWACIEWNNNRWNRNNCTVQQC